MDWGGTSWEPIIEQKCSSERATNAFLVRSGDLSRADEGRPILPLLLTGEVEIIEKFLYIEKVEHGDNPRVATISREGETHGGAEGCQTQASQVNPVISQRAILLKISGSLHKKRSRRRSNQIVGEIYWFTSNREASIRRT